MPFSLTLTPKQNRQPILNSLEFLDPRKPYSSAELDAWALSLKEREKSIGQEWKKVKLEWRQRREEVDREKEKLRKARKERRALKTCTLSTTAEGDVLVKLDGELVTVLEQSEPVDQSAALASGGRPFEMDQATRKPLSSPYSRRDRQDTRLQDQQLQSSGRQHNASPHHLYSPNESISRPNQSFFWKVDSPQQRDIRGERAYRPDVQGCRLASREMKFGIARCVGRVARGVEPMLDMPGAWVG